MSTITAADKTPPTNTVFDPKQVYYILQKKGIPFLHHANTVATTKTFFQQKALLSRDHVEKAGLYQTSQKSDALDKRYGIWDYIFLDGLHIANAFGRNNLYGPILFKLSTSVLLSDQVKSVRITQTNPANWSGDPSTALDRYCHNSLEEFDSQYAQPSGCKGCDNFRDANMMLMLECENGRLNLKDYLSAVEIDDPDYTLKNGKDLFDKVIEYLRPDFKAIGTNGTSIRNVKNTFYYRLLRDYDFPTLVRLFGPKLGDPRFSL